ncbi:MAG TPA: hypothetical protein VF266_02650 [Thermoanaerobaculia bacterium]
MSSSRALLSLVIALFLVAAAPQKQDVAKLTAAAAHAEVAAAVKTQNALAVPLVAVKVIDQRWFLNKEMALVRQATTGKCADVLREFVAANPAYDQAFLLDQQGAIVCSNARTTQYWFGQEPFFERAFRGETFRDASVIAVPVKEEDRVVGVLVIRAKLTS